MGRRPLTMFAAAAAMAAAASLMAACGSGNNSSTSAPSTPSSAPSGAVNAKTITIANNAVSPKNIVVARGSQVTFVNNDTVPHEMFSDPHPDHTDCPEINQVGFLNPGQTRQTGNMTTNRTVCGFHDHGLPDVAGLQGSITIQ
jgi:plastocyanin